MITNYSNPFLDEYTPFIMNLIIYFVLAFVLSLIFKAFICAAINFDAKARGVKEKTMYTVLSFFFPIIVGIIYLCRRKNCPKIQPKLCNQCHTTVDTKSTFCPNCLGTEFTDYRIQNDVKYHKTSKIFLIIAIVVYVVTCVVNVFFNVYFSDNADKFISDLEKYTDGYSDSYDNSDDFDADDYFNQFGGDDGNSDYENYDEQQPDFDGFDW